MECLKEASDSVHWFMSELWARVVAESGIPSDRHHFGKLLLQSLKDAPDFVMQIDGVTGQSETYRSVLQRTVQCAACFKKLGLKVGDVIVLMGPGHLDLAIPLYGALYLGIAVSALDANLGISELEKMFKINQPKLVFCQNERTPIIKEALKKINLDSKVITFDNSNDCINFSYFIKEYGKEADVEKFRFITMSDKRHQHDAVHWHMNDITSRIIAESRIPSDRFHLGKIIIESMKDDPELVAQIDGATGQSETNPSLLRRSIQCAIGFRKLGLQRGDVMILMAPNHLDLIVPFYAALFEGLIIAPVDKTLGVAEIADTFEVNKPSIIFCQSEKLEDIQSALSKVNLKASKVSFDDASDATLSELLDSGSDEKEIENYRAADFDPDETIAMLIATSGTTGLPKAAACTHKNFALMTPYLWVRTTEIPYIKVSLLTSPLQWLSAILNFVSSPIMKFTRIQSSLPSTQEHVYHLINTYKPTFMIVSPTMMATLMNPGDRDRCDFTCFKWLCLGGSAVHSDLITDIKVLTPETEVLNGYGMSELSNLVFSHEFSSPPHSFGKPLSCLQYRLVDHETGNDINEPNIPGELWLKGPGIFKGYYNNPEATKAVFAEDGWFKSGDILYRDESWNFFFVERIKLLLKYDNHQISPVELESVIMKHPGVLDVAVTAIPDKEHGDLPVACVVKSPGYSVTAQEIKDLVKESLADSKQLRGGVVFMNQLPATASTKLHRRKIKEMVLYMNRE